MAHQVSHQLVPAFTSDFISYCYFPQVLYATLTDFLPGILQTGLSACRRCCQYPAQICQVGRPSINWLSHRRSPRPWQGGTEVPGSSSHHWLTGVGVQIQTLAPGWDALHTLVCVLFIVPQSVSGRSSSSHPRWSWLDNLAFIKSFPILVLLPYSLPHFPAPPK